MDIKEAKKLLAQLNPANKFGTMIQTASVITSLLEPYKIKPVIVGGLSVEFYTQKNYTTRDIDFVSDGYDRISQLLLDLGFIREGRHHYHEALEVAIEIPDSYLAGDYDKISKITLTNQLYVYMISIEDIILDRLRAATAWQSKEDTKWGFRLLSENQNILDKSYLFAHCETTDETNELKRWFQALETK